MEWWWWVVEWLREKRSSLRVIEGKNVNCSWRGGTRTENFQHLLNCSIRLPSQRTRTRGGVDVLLELHRDATAKIFPINYPIRSAEAFTPESIYVDIKRSLWCPFQRTRLLKDYDRMRWWKFHKAFCNDLQWLEKASKSYGEIIFTSRNQLPSERQRVAHTRRNLRCFCVRFPSRRLRINRSKKQF